MRLKYVRLFYVHCSQQLPSPGQAVASKNAKHRGCSDRSAAVDITMRDEL